jgi:hypothetical protein
MAAHSPRTPYRPESGTATRRRRDQRRSGLAPQRDSNPCRHLESAVLVSRGGVVGQPDQDRPGGLARLTASQCAGLRATPRPIWPNSGPAGLAPGGWDR